MALKSPEKSVLLVFNYSDYREFLHDWFWFTKKQNAKLSFRFVSKQLGFSSPNQFHLVIGKKRHLSASALDRVCRLLHLDAKERQYLKTLFLQNQSDDPSIKNKLTDKLELLRKGVLAGSDLASENFRILTHQLTWYIKMGAVAFEGKTRAALIDVICRSACFPVSYVEAENALDNLLRLKLLHFNKNGLACFDRDSIKTKWDLDRFEIKQHHHNNLQLALQSISWPIDRRFLSSVTIPCDAELYQEVIAELRSLCLSILERSNQRMYDSSDVNKIVTLQLALFPYFDF